MTPELAKLLDGPVAERWGRPKSRVGSEIQLDDDVWRSDSHDGEKCHCCPSDGDAYHADYLNDDPEAEALWLAHLMAVCGEQCWEVHVHTRIGGGWNATVEGERVPAFGISRQSETLLAALADAMLAVPEGK